RPREAEVVITVRVLEVARDAFLPVAAPGVRTDVAAEVEVADPVREGQVVGVRSPEHTGLRARGRVHRVEGVRKHLAGVTARLVLDLAEPVGSARHHLARVARRVVVDDGRETAGRVGQGHGRLIARVEEEGVRVVRLPEVAGSNWSGFGGPSGFPS